MAVAALLISGAAALAPGVAQGASGAATTAAAPAPEIHPEASESLVMTPIEPPADLLREIEATTGTRALPGDTSCWTFTTNGDPEGEACNEWNGDDMWVRDLNDNEAQFRVHLQTDYEKDRYCADNTSGWTQCDYDHRENSCLKWHGYFPPHWSGMHWPWSAWYGTSGDRC